MPTPRFDWGMNTGDVTTRRLSELLREEAMKPSLFMRFVGPPAPRPWWRRRLDGLTYHWWRLQQRVHRFVHLDEDD